MKSVNNEVNVIVENVTNDSNVIMVNKHEVIGNDNNIEYDVRKVKFVERCPDGEFKDVEHYNSSLEISERD